MRYKPLLQRAVFLAVIFLGLAFIVRAQKQGNIWILENNVGLDFNSSPPAFFRPFRPGQRVPYTYATSSICDSGGRLLCWSNGPEAYGPYGLMTNGSGLGTGSSTNVPLIVPKPGSDSLIYVFNSSENTQQLPLPKAYSYSVINTCLDWRRPDSIRGNVVPGQRAVKILDSSMTLLCGASDGSGGYWILGHRSSSDSFIAWHLTSSGLSGRVATAIGPKIQFGNGDIRTMKFNPAGTKVALLAPRPLHSGLMATLDLFDFNPVTGRLSNHCQNYVDSNVFCVGLEFSPDGSKIYSVYTNGAMSYLIQNKVLTNCSLVGLSRDTIFQTTFLPSRVQGDRLFDLQAGPDGYLYIVVESSRFRYNRLFRITNPNYTPGIDSTAIRQDTSARIVYLPSFIAGFRYHNQVPKCQAPTAILPATPAADFLRLSPNPANGVIILTGSPVQAPYHDLMLSDATGRRVARFGTIPTSIDTRSWPSGIYFWQATSSSGDLQSGKIVVDH